MNPSRIWTIGAAVAVVVVLGAAVALGIVPALSAASAAKAATAQTDTANSGTLAQLASLSRVAAKQSDLQADADDLRWAIPRTLQLNTFSKQLRSVAALDGVTLTVLSPGDATAYVVPDTAAAAASTTTSTTSTTSTTTTTAAATPAATTGATTTTATAPGWFGKTDDLITSANFLVIPVSVTVTGTEAAGVAFAADVQQMRRLFVVNNVSFVAGSGTDSPSSTVLIGNIYALKR